MLATTFYRMVGSPSLEDKNLGYPFSDVPGDGWYADGVYWARMEGVVGGYGNNAFGPDDPVTREQAVTILWRYAGSPTASSGTFSDSDDLADWAVSAAGWAQAMGLLIGWADSSFLPQTPLTRAEVAVLLARYLEGGEATADGSSSILVAYFSATGTTRPLAEYAADMLISSRTEKKKEETDRWKRELKKVDKRMAELSKILNKLYEDLALEKISEERYQAMAPDYEREQILLREKREQLTAKIAQSEEIYENVEKFLPVIWKHTNLTELTAHALNDLIEKIVVHEKAMAADGSKSQQVDIYYKFIGCINRKRSFASYAAPEKAALQEHLSPCSQTA